MPSIARFARTPLSRALQPIILGLGLSISGLTSSLAVAATEQQENRQHFHIAAGPLEPALNQFGEQAGVLLSFSPSLTEGRQTQGLNGSYSVSEALAALLDGSGLRANANGDSYTLQLAGLAIEVERQVVIGSRAPTSISELPGTVWVIDSTQLQEQTKAGLPLKEALGQLIPGLDIGPQGRTNYGQNLRGRSALVMIDGVSLNSSRSISRQFDSIDPFNIERIEVLSGASAVYGGGATGGIINIVTRKGESGPARFNSEIGVRSGLGHSDDHDWHVAQSVSGGSDTVSGRLAVAYQKNGAAYDGNDDQVLIDITQTDLQYNRSVDVMGNLDLRFDERQRLGITAQYYDSGYDGSKGLYLGNNLAGLGNPALVDIRSGFDADVEPHTKRQLLNLDYQQDDVLGGQTLYVQAFARREKLDFYPFPGNVSQPGLGSLPYYGSSQQNTDYYGLKTVLSKKWSQFELTYGLDLDRENFDAKQALFNTARSYSSGGLQHDKVGSVGRYPGYRIDGLSLFGQGSYKLDDALTLSAGWRRQRMTVKVDDFAAFDRQVFIANGIGASVDKIPGGEKDYDVNLYNAGAVYKLSSAQQVWANYSEGFELPDPGKYYGFGTYAFGGMGGNWQLLDSVSVDDSPLSGIKTKQVETGWRHYADGLDAQVAAFYAWSDKSITYNRLTLAVEQQDDKKRNYGLEGQLSYWLNDNWQVGTSALAIRSQQKVDGSWEKQDVTAASPSKATAFLGWQNGTTSLRLQAVRSFNLSDDGNLVNGAFDGKDHKIDGYATFDLLGSQVLPVGMLNFGIQNLLDKDYTTVWGQRAQVFYGALASPDIFDFKGRGRTYSLSYSVEF